MPGQDNGPLMSHLRIPRKKTPVTDVHPPVIGAEKAEEKIYEEAIEKDEIISEVRTKIGDKK